MLWRTLAVGVTGPEVSAVEASLVALGYDPEATVTVDAVFDGATAAMVARFQAAVGQPSTGTVPLGSVVMAPGPVRVGEPLAAVGEALGVNAAVMRISSTARLAVFGIDPAQRDLLSVGATVQVRLPDRREVPGTVSAIASNVDSQAGTYRVDVAVADVGTFTSDQLQVTVTGSVTKFSSVLSVPPNALVALEGGGYQVRVAQPDGTVKPVSVEVLGAAGRLVAVSGDGLDPSTLLVVP